jgi:predicted RNase H-like nuclease (RuvC/YqgF family)
MTRRLLALTVLTLPALAAAQNVVYRCPGPPVLYTDALSPKEAADRGCKSIEGAPVSVVQAPRPRPPAATPSAAPREGTIAERDAQRARDSDRRAVLTAELRDAEARLAALKAEYNNGEPERRGDERNYAKYQERVAELKAAVSRQEADIAALKRELAKLN